MKITSEGDITTVQCEATHLTSFAVLVDVNEGQKVRMGFSVRFCIEGGLPCEVRRILSEAPGRGN